MKSVIFDIDGTLADGSHRRHLVTGGQTRWDAYLDACNLDVPIYKIIELVCHFHDLDYKIILVSGRSDQVKEKTEQWLAQQKVPYHELHMRKQGDYRKDFIIKEEILDDLLKGGYIIHYVIDDRPTVVAMWRKRGLTCLQCASYEENYMANAQRGLLTLLIGPSGAGKSTFVQTYEATQLGIHPSHVISSDQLRQDLCGDFRDQTKNEAVFNALHAIVKTRIDHGIPAAVDATNIRKKDRTSLTDLAQGGPVRYIVIDRPMLEKRKTAGWRAELPFDLLGKHQQTFDAQLKDILKGDGLPNVEVFDLRGKI